MKRNKLTSNKILLQKINEFLQEVPKAKFIFQITGKNINNELLEKVNKEKGFKEKINLIEFEKCKINYHDLTNEIFKNNLILIDSKMPQIIAELMLRNYSIQSSNLKDLTDLISKEDPLNYGDESGRQFYHYKIKRLLADFALGMTPSKVWRGTLAGEDKMANGFRGVLYYYFYYKNELIDYLLANTRLETASTTRHDFGSIYKEGGEYFMKLNLQIRFLI